jgi:hypothetical protein
VAQNNPVLLLLHCCGCYYCRGGVRHECSCYFKLRRTAALLLLLLSGARIQIAVFGTSITQGFHKSKGFAETWAHEVPRWLQKAFPSADVELINLARDASDVTPAAVCW